MDRIVAVDTSTLIAWFLGNNGKDVEILTGHLKEGLAMIPPPVLVEVLSNHATRDKVATMLQGMKRLEILEGFWLRASALRAGVLQYGLKAHMTDTLIAQCCIDHAVPLITRDADFRHFVTCGGLMLL